MDAAQESINTAYAQDVKLRKRIFDAISETPQHLSLFHDIARYQLQTASSTSTNTSASTSDEQPSKKRKLDAGAVNGAAGKEQPRSVVLEARDLSFTLPQRKKLHLSIVQYGEQFDGPDTSFALCIRNPATNQVELEVPTKAFAYALKVPVPEKAQKSYNYCFLPPTQLPASGSQATSESIIWTVNEGPLKSCTISSPDLQSLVGTDDVLGTALNTVLGRSENKIIVPTEGEFASAIPEAHRKNQKSYHVKAHRGSKDGFLFFLENGIFFGFKKPLAFFPFHDIESVSYTAVLQRTFNLIVSTQGDQTTEDAEPQEIEFAMLDQADFAGIDAYIKKHQLQDASLADARRAKQYKVNGRSAAQDTDGDDGGELQKAQAEMQQEEEDEEDAMEEDYDPGSEGDSEGSGSSDEEDEYDDHEKPKNLVQDELGSEAEDVSVSDPDEEVENEEGDEEEEEEEEPEEHEEPTHEQARPKESAQGVARSPVLPIHPAGAPSFDDEDQL